MVDGKPINLGLWDTAGKKNEKVATSSYQQFSVILCWRLFALQVRRIMTDFDLSPTPRQMSSSYVFPSLIRPHLKMLEQR